jgi:hypothetical protein
MFEIFSYLFLGGGNLSAVTFSFTPKDKQLFNLKRLQDEGRGRGERQYAT